VQKLNPEYTLTVLKLLKEGKTEKEIAIQTQKHRNTVSRYLMHIRNSNIYDIALIKNKILSELDTRIPDMEDRDLIAFYAKLLPTTTNTEPTEEEPLSNLDRLTDEQRTKLDAAATVLFQIRNTPSTTEPNTIH
jgi:hypothetical protein